MLAPGRNTGQEDHQSGKNNSASTSPVCILEMFYAYFYHARVYRMSLVPLLKKYVQVHYGYRALQ